MAGTPAFKPDLKASKPSRTIFDAWNSSSTGHQRAENRLSGSTAWRDSRTLKLGEQFSDTIQGGGKRMADTVGAGSEHFGKDGRLDNGGWARGASGLRAHGQLSLFECNSRSVKSTASSRDQLVEAAAKSTSIPLDSDCPDQADDDTPPLDNSTTNSTPPSAQVPSALSDQRNPPQIFANLTIYINGSTYPTISDHKLKRLLITHGASLSLSHARRSVTHVILGDPERCGGGLAAGKLQREIGAGRTRVRFVKADWVVECVRVGRRVSEGPFQVVQVGGVGQRGVAGLFAARVQARE